MRDRTMIKRRYHDFVLLVEEDTQPSTDSSEAYTVRVFLSPAGEGEEREPFTLPDAVENLPTYGTLDSRRSQLARRNLAATELVELGQWLYKILLRPHARKLFDRSLAGLGKHEGLRIRLRMPRRLAILPWEYMCLDEEGESPDSARFIALDERLSIVRHEAIATPYEKPRFGDTRYVLIAMASPEPRGDYPPLGELPLEQREITAALSKIHHGIQYKCLPSFDEDVDYTRLAGAQREQIRSFVTEQPEDKIVDVFHFGGHGTFRKEQGPEFATYEGTGLIVLADPENQADPITGNELGELIGQRGIQLVTLGACESGERDIFNAWSSVAVALLKRSIPSVVAMQFTAKDELAAVFMTTVYKGLVAGCTIDEAVSVGRKAVRARCYGKYAGSRDWGTPVLYSRAPNGYIFPPVEDEQARQQAEQELSLLSALHQAWWNWTNQQVLVGTRQLRSLDELKEELQIQPAQALLLLRSAVQVNEPVETWLDHLRRTGAELMVELDDPATAFATREEASVFELEDVPEQGRPQDVGAVAWSAVSHPDPAPRHTAAMALTALPEDPGAGPERVSAGLARIRGALAGIKRPWKRYARKAELRGALADGDPQIEQVNGGLPPWDRFGIWAWRFGRRVAHDWERIVLLMLGGGLGAGLGLGLLRGLVAFFTEKGRDPGLFLQMYGYSGAFLGATLCLGMQLAGPALLKPMRRWGMKQEPPDFKAKLAAVLLGALFFGLGHSLLFGLRGNAIAESLLVYPFGFVMGLGLSLALYGQPRTGHKLGVASALLRVGLAAAVSAGIQAVLIWGPDTGGALDVALSRNFYAAFFSDRVPQSWLSWLALIDAALAGVVLTIGLNVGLGQANRLAEWLQGLKERATE